VGMPAQGHACAKHQVTPFKHDGVKIEAVVYRLYACLAASTGETGGTGGGSALWDRYTGRRLPGYT
jgi:hypothetical protein